MSEPTEFDSKELSNGHTAQAVLDRAAAPAITIQRMPVKIRRVELEGDYTGWWADMHMNPPIGTIIEMESGAATAVFEYLPTVIRDWNFGDPEGTKVPITPEGLRSLPPDLLQELGRAWADARTIPLASSAS